MHVHVRTHPRHWESFSDCFQPPDWSYICLLLVNTGSVCVCLLEIDISK